MNDPLDGDDPLEFGNYGGGRAEGRREAAEPSERRPGRKPEPAGTVRANASRKSGVNLRVPRATLLLWGAPDQGKTAYLWAIGRRLRETKVGGFHFSALLESFQLHWTRLNRKRESKTWARTELDGSGSVQGAELNLFRIARVGAWHALSRLRVEVVTKDVPGETIDHIQGSRPDSTMAAAAIAEATRLRDEASACFVMVRGDQICRSGGDGAEVDAKQTRERQARAACDMIRQSLSVLGEGRGRTAVVLTACDNIPDVSWRRRLGFDGSGRESGDPVARRKAAREFLCAQDPFVGESLDRFPEIEVFATAAFAEPDPLYVHEPLVWVLQHEFQVREREVRRKRIRGSLALLATVSLLAAAGSHAVTAPLANAVDDRRVATDAVAPAIADLPEWLLRLDRPRAVAGLHAEAVGLARANRMADAGAALQKLERLDPQGYHFTRAQIEAFHTELQRAQTAGSPPGGGDQGAGDLVEKQLTGAQGRLDRYGESTMQLRRILLLARSSRDPRDAATSAILDGLAANRTFAVQHGEEVGSALFAQWMQRPPATAEQLDVLLSTLSRLRALITREAWLALMVKLSPPICEAVLKAAAGEDVDPMRMLVGWPADDRAVQTELQRVLTAKCIAILTSDTPAGAGARDALANLYCANADVAASLESLHLHVVDALVHRRDEQGMRRLRPVVIAAPGDPALRLAAADWASMQANVALDPKAAVATLATAYREAIATVPPSAALAEIKRFAFVAELCARRHARSAETVQRELAAMAAALALRDGVLETIAPPDAEWVAGRMTTGSSVQDIDRIETVSRAVVARAGKIPPATVAVIVAEFVSFLRSVSANVPAERMREFNGLASSLVAPVLSGAIGSDAQALVQVVGCWRAVDPTEPERSRLDDMAASIVNTILGTPAWGDDACDAISWVLSEHADPKSFLAKVDQPQKLVDVLAAFGTAAFARSKAEAAARALASVHAAQPAAAREVVRNALRAAVEASPEASATEVTVWVECLRALVAKPVVRGDFLAVVAEGIGRLLDGASGQPTVRQAQVASALVEVVRDDAAIVETMPTGLRRVLVAQDLAQALQFAAVRQSESGAARVAAAARWMSIDAVMVTETVARSTVVFEAALAGLLDMRDLVGSAPGPVSGLIETMVEELVRRGGKVDNATTMLGALNRLVQRPIAGKPASPALAELLDQQCQAAAARGDLSALIDRWRVAAACARIELATKAAWPKADAAALRQLAAASRLRNPEGWTVRQAASAMESAFRVDVLDRTSVAEWFVGLAVQIIAPVLGLGEVGGVNALADSNISAAGMQSASEEQVRFACELTGATLQEFAEAKVDPAVRGGVELALAKLTAVALRTDAAISTLTTVSSVLPSESDARFAVALRAQVGAGMRADKSPVAARALALAATNLGDRGPAQYGPALEAALADAEAESAGGAAWTTALGQMRTARAWSEERHRLLSEAVLRTLRGELATGKPLLTLNTRTVAARQLIDAYDGFANRTGAAAWSARLQGALELDFAAMLASMPPEQWDGVARTFDGLPILAGYVVTAQATAALATGRWSTALPLIEKVADAAVASRMRNFLANAETMVPLQTAGGAIAYLAPTEVTVQQYDQFVAAMQADRQKLAALAASIGWQVELDAALAVLSPGDTADDLRRADLPVHKVAWWGARMYCAWRGLELPTVAVLTQAWGQGDYPWGDEWSSTRSVTAERFSQGETIKLLPVRAGNDVSSTNVYHLHGNVRELTADGSSLGEVVRFGGSAWEMGKSVSRSNPTDIDAAGSARERKVPGVGFRVMLTPPTSWQQGKR
jgi:hypothetical protein